MAHDEREPNDSLDRIERQLALEDALAKKITADTSLSAAKRRELIREIETWRERGVFLGVDDGDADWDDDDALNILVRKLGPRGPLGRLGATARPESDGA